MSSRRKKRRELFGLYRGERGLTASSRKKTQGCTVFCREETNGVTVFYSIYPQESRLSPVLYSLKGLSHEIFTVFWAGMDLSRPE
jgi:hypothetical protein